MNDAKILGKINKIIISENGLPVQPGNLFIQSELDSLGVMIALLSIEGEFKIPTDQMNKIVENIPGLTVNELIDLCKSSSTNT